MKNKVVSMSSTLHRDHVPLTSQITVKLFYYMGNKILLFDNYGHVRGHLNSWIFELNTQLVIKQHFVRI